MGGQSAGAGDGNNMPTYGEITAWVEDNYGWTIHHTCWIAHCKELAGIPVDPAWNRTEGGRAAECPPDRRPAIFAAFRHFGMID